MFCAYCGSQRPDNATFCPSCGKSINALGNTTPVTAAPLGVATATSTETAFFNVGTTKLVLMSVSTFNIYVLYWLYKNWVAERELSGALITPWARALFAVIFIHSLAARVRDRLIAVEQIPVIQPGAITIGFIGLCLCERLPDPWWLLSSLLGFVLVPVQNEMARINAALGAPRGEESKFSAINIVWLTIAALFWLLLLVGLFLPEVE